MSSSHRMRWRPAVGVLVLGGIAIGLSLQAASAKRERTTVRPKAESLTNAPVVSPSNPAVVSNIKVNLGTQAEPVDVKIAGLSSATVSQVAPVTPATVTFISPDDGFDPSLSTASVRRTSTMTRADAQSDVIAGPGLGACCVAPAACSNNILPGACVGTHFPGQACIDDPCGFAVGACCSAAGVCTGDTTRAACEPAGRWHVDASCVGAAARPLPVCNATNCSWDNGAPLNDGGNSRSHLHTLGIGQLPRYSFLTADDFELGLIGGDLLQCEITSVRAFHKQRRQSPVQVPDPNLDWEAGAVTVYAQFTDPNTNFLSPAGYGTEPAYELDGNPKSPLTTGGIVYSRLFPNDASAMTFTFVPGFCDPPAGNEDADLWQIDFAVDPPILLNKSVRYWISVEGVFPFNDGLRNALQTWAALSVNNTLSRGRTTRTGNGAYIAPSGDQVWLPTFLTQTGATGGTQPGNAGAGTRPTPPNCANLPTGTVPANTRLGYAFRLIGVKASNTLDADLCSVINPIIIRDGYTPINTTGAATNGPAASCGTPLNDLWFQYESTCFGQLTVDTSGTTFNSIAVVYDSVGFTCATPGLGIACSTMDSGNDAYAIAPVNFEGLFYIRVGSDDGSVGKGIIALTCTPACGNPAAADCCDADIECNVELGNADCPVGSVCGGPNLPVSINKCSISAGPCLVNADCPPTETCQNVCDYALFGCTNEECCNVVCALDPICCGAFLGKWDDQCALSAQAEVVCSCPCLFTPLPAATPEAEGLVEGTACGVCPTGATCVLGVCDCKANLNGGCNQLPLPEAFETIACGAVIDGKSWADANFRDTDWYRFSVSDANADGEAELVILIRSSIPIGIQVTGSETDTGTPLTSFCSNTDKCSVTDTQSCVLDSDCPSGETCEDEAATLVGHDIISTGACLDRIMTVCVPAPGVYALVTFPVDTDIVDGEEVVGAGIFNGYGCGTSNDYSFSLVCNDVCQPGACCTCLGVCVDGLTENECNDIVGTYKGEGTLCSAVGTECPADAHPCAVSTLLTCGGAPGIADLTALGLDPAPLGYSCGNAGNNPTGSKWFHFVATGPSARVHTCATPSIPGGDSLLAVYSGNCCGTGLNELAEIGCDDDTCGFNLFMGTICLDNLTINQTYYIQVSNWNEDTHGQYTVTVSCPCTGSCCNDSTGVCVDGTAIENCQGANDSFSELQTCAQLDPPCGLGACCNIVTGTCTDSIPSACPSGSNHFPGTDCTRVICNTGDTCDFDNGAFANVDGFTSQLFIDNGQLIEMADDFNLKSLPSGGDNGCLLETLYYETFHTSHDIPNGCSSGGGAQCNDTAADYMGILVTISPDLAGVAKGPTCVPSLPVAPGGDGDYHEPLGVAGAQCINVVLGPAPKDPPVSGSYWSFASVCEGQCEQQITITFDPPLLLDKNKKYWLGVTHIWRETGGYSIVWGRSDKFNGNLAQQFISTGSGNFEPQPDGDGVDEDLAFKFTGGKEGYCGSCRLYGDVQPGFCIVDVDDLVYILSAFSDADPCNNFPGADITPCGDPCVIVDVDDLVNVLGAFAGEAPPFPCVDPCVSGGCILPSTECRDEFYVPDGMSAQDCAALLGTYCGDGVLCGDAGCP